MHHTCNGHREEQVRGQDTGTYDNAYTWVQGIKHMYRALYFFCLYFFFSPIACGKVTQGNSLKGKGATNWSSYNKMTVVKQKVQGRRC